MFMRYKDEDGNKKMLMDIKTIDFIGNEQYEITRGDDSIVTLEDIEILTISHS